MSFALHNSAARKKVDFKPIDPAHVRIYACGPTVYDLAHVGNARMMVVFDLIVRVLRDAFPKVTYVRNITDVDDKINAAATEQGLPIDVITSRTTQAMHEDMAALGVFAARYRATGYRSYCADGDDDRGPHRQGPCLRC